MHARRKGIKFWGIMSRRSEYERLARFAGIDPSALRFADDEEDGEEEDGGGAGGRGAAGAGAAAAAPPRTVSMARVEARARRAARAVDGRTAQQKQALALSRAGIIAADASAGALRVRAEAAAAAAAIAVAAAAAAAQRDIFAAAAPEGGAAGAALEMPRGASDALARDAGEDAAALGARGVGSPFAAALATAQVRRDGRTHCRIGVRWANALPYCCVLRVLHLSQEHILFVCLFCSLLLQACGRRRPPHARRLPVRRARVRAAGTRGCA